jgi:integrase
MSCGVYFKSLTSFSKVTVREYYRGFFAKVNIMLPYGNIQYYKPGEKAGIFPYGNKAWSPPSTHSCPTKKKLEALNYPVGMTRLDLTLKITGVDGSESTERPTMESDFKAIVITPAQRLAILKALPSPLHFTLVLTCAATAPRASEILALRWSDLLWNEGRIRVFKTLGNRQGWRD